MLYHRKLSVGIWSWNFWGCPLTNIIPRFAIASLPNVEHWGVPLLTVLSPRHQLGVSVSPSVYHGQCLPPDFVLCLGSDGHRCSPPLTGKCLLTRIPFLNACGVPQANVARNACLFLSFPIQHPTHSTTMIVLSVWASATIYWCH